MLVILQLAAPEARQPFRPHERRSDVFARSYQEESKKLDGLERADVERTRHKLHDVCVVSQVIIWTVGPAWSLS